MSEDESTWRRWGYADHTERSLKKKEKRTDATRALLLLHFGGSLIAPLCVFIYTLL